MDFPIFKCMIDEKLDSDLEVDFMSLVGKPAIEKNFMAFNEAKLKFNVDTERRIVSGPAMIPNMLMYRNSPEMGEYYVVFDAPTIQTIALKFFKKGLTKSINIMHDANQQTQAVTIFESFITDSTRGIMPMKGFEDTAEGTWFISAKVEDDAVWERVKNGELKGFSAEGIFKLMPVKTQEYDADKILGALAKMLEGWNGN